MGKGEIEHERIKGLYSITDLGVTLRVTHGRLQESGNFVITMAQGENHYVVARLVPFYYNVPLQYDEMLRAFSSIGRFLKKDPQEWLRNLTPVQMKRIPWLFETAQDAEYILSQYKEHHKDLVESSAHLKLVGWAQFHTQLSKANF